MMRIWTRIGIRQQLQPCFISRSPFESLFPWLTGCETLQPEHAHCLSWRKCARDNELISHLRCGTLTWVTLVRVMIWRPPLTQKNKISPWCTHAGVELASPRACREGAVGDLPVRILTTYQYCCFCWLQSCMIMVIDPLSLKFEFCYKICKTWI